MKRLIVVLLFVSFCVWIVNKNILISRQPNIFIISLDTLRNDAVGGVDDKGERLTPNIDQFSKDAVRYSNAYAPIPFTLSSHMSMLTGVYPDVHLVVGESKVPGHNGERILSKKIKTITEVLHNRKYSTIGIVSSRWLNSDFGFGRGFDLYERIDHSPDMATRITDNALDIISKIEKINQPIFLFLHYYDPHSDFWNDKPPYCAPKLFQISKYKSLSKYFCTDDGRCATQYLVDVNMNKIMLSKEDIRDLKELYYGGVRFVDSEVGKLISGLRKRDMYENSLIIITSDHGEEFQEHGFLLHEQNYEATTRIPLLIKYPGNKDKGIICKTVCDVVDFFPTILDVLNIPFLRQLQGQSLFPDKFLGADRYNCALILDKKDRNLYTLRDGKYKLFYNANTGDISLFDISVDPKEKKDISEKMDDVAKLLMRKIKRKIIDNKHLAEVLMDDQNSSKEILNKLDREKLKSLGYLQ